MSMIPVIWWNANPDAPHRGYWDQGWLEDLLAGDPYPVLDATDHVEASTPGEVALAIDYPFQGAVVVVPGRQNVEHADALDAFLDRLDWAVVIITGDEEHTFPVEKIRGAQRLIWTMTPGAPGARVLPSGYPPGLRSHLRTLGLHERQTDVFFAGQVTHPRREEALRAIRDWTSTRPFRSARTVATAGFTQGLDQRDYWTALATAKVAPSPSGPVSPDSMRTIEALECGAIPVADDRTAFGPQFDYWESVLGPELLPFPTVRGSWDGDDVFAALDAACHDWPVSANRTQEWWLRTKWRTARALAADVRSASGLDTHDEYLTVLMPTSPTPICPSTEHIEQTIESVRAQLPEALILLMLDGVAPHLEHRRADYEEYQRRLLHLANLRWENVVPLRHETWTHQAAMTRDALSYVETPLILFVEHDTPIGGEIPWDALCSIVASGELNLVRLNHESEILAAHEHLMLDPEPRVTKWPDTNGHMLSIRRTVQWSQRPHLASTRFYRELLDAHFSPGARTMIEDVMHGVVQNPWNDHGESGWWDWRLGIYEPVGDTKRSWHLDSRGDDEKGQMIR